MTTSFKVQNILNQSQESKTKIALTHFFEIEDEDKLEKLGRLYVVMSLESDEITDFKPLTKAFLDTLKDTYYQSSGETPLNAIEKALNRAYQTLIAANNAELNKFNIKGLLKISVSTALIWHKILYASYIHKPAVYLIRGSGVRNIAVTPTTDGEIWTSSIILENEDVIVIGTEKFAEIAPANKIINSLNEINEIIHEYADKSLVAATLIKVIQSETDKNRGGMSFLAIEKIKENSIKFELSNKLSMIKEKLGLNIHLSDKFKVHQIKKPAPVSSISGIVSTAQSQSVIETAKRISHKKNDKKNYLKFILGTVALSFIIATFLYLYFKKPENKNTKLNETKQSKNENPNPTKKDSEKPKEIIKKFTDLHPLIFDANLNQNNYKIEKFTLIGTNQIAFINKSTKLPKLYKISEKTIGNLIGSTINPKFIKCDQRLCYILDNNSILIFDPKTPEKVDRYLIQNIEDPIDIFPYGNKIYILNDSTVYSQTLQEKEPKPWIEDPNVALSNPISFTIDSNIFVLQEKNVLKFQNGKLITTYDITETIKDPKQIANDAKNIYILDDANDSIFIYQKSNFSFLKEIKLAEKEDPNGINGFSLVAENGKTAIFFSKGGNAYKIAEKF